MKEVDTQGLSCLPFPLLPLRSELLVLAVLTLCSFVLAVALVTTTLLVVCLFKHTPLALVTPEVIIIIILILTSCGVRARACSTGFALCCVCVALCLLRLDRSSLGNHKPTHSPTHRDFYSKRNTSLRDKTNRERSLSTLNHHRSPSRGKGEISTMPHAGGNGPKKMTLPSRAGIALVFIIIIIIIIIH